MNNTILDFSTMIESDKKEETVGQRLIPAFDYFERKCGIWSICLNKPKLHYLQCFKKVISDSKMVTFINCKDLDQASKTIGSGLDPKMLRSRFSNVQLNFVISTLVKSIS